MIGAGFILLLGEDIAELQGRAARAAQIMSWQCRWIDERMALLADERMQLAAAPGITGTAVLGTLFHRHGPGEPIAALDTVLAQAIQEGRTSLLLERYWGAYLAVSRTEGGLSVLRDPSGFMPCYYQGVGSSLAITSSVPALVRAGLLRPHLSWDGIAQILCRGGLPASFTAIERVQELLPGNALHLEDGRLCTMSHWSPWDHVKTGRAEDPSAWAERLRRTVDSSVGAWARLFGHVLATVSGGLDSSIVLTSAKRAATRVTSITLSTDDPAGDERSFARQICAHVGSPLVEAEYDLADLVLLQSSRSRLPRPIGRTPELAYDAAVGRVAGQIGADALFTGNGGDNVFAYSQSAGAIADRLRSNGISSELWSTTRDVCLLTGCNMFQAARAGLRMTRGSGRYRWRPEQRLLAAQVAAQFDADTSTHPWLDTPPDALPGKAAHIAALLRIQQHLDGTGRFNGTVVVNPLMSQPIVEACLAIPSWMWCHGGRNRAVARLAFSNAMPAAIVGRTSKGGPDGFGTRILSCNRDRIAERVLNGHLARQGLIDRAAIEAMLFTQRPDLGPEQLRLLEFLDTEAWIDHWLSAV
jgi:asparagine synthase (glutamine-hydrolysing)